jgi:hypothetical protein
MALLSLPCLGASAVEEAPADDADKVKFQVVLPMAGHDDPYAVKLNADPQFREREFTGAIDVSVSAAAPLRSIPVLILHALVYNDAQHAVLGVDFHGPFEQGKKHLLGLPCGQYAVSVADGDDLVYQAETAVSAATKLPITIAKPVRFHGVVNHAPTWMHFGPLVTIGSGRVVADLNGVFSLETHLQRNAPVKQR